MDLKTFFEHFDTLAEAPNGLQRLRELILDMAVRGKLVPQDPEDEPASVLLDRISTEKTYLAEKGQIKKPRKLPKIGDDEKPFDLPRGWELCRFGDAVEVINGRAYKKNEMLDQGTPLHHYFV
jgi:type I restriction enzyme S subunit